MNAVNSQEQRRHSFTMRAIDKTRDALSDANVNYTVGENEVHLADILDNVVIPDIIDGEASLPEDCRDTDATPIIALAKNETVAIGDGFYVQSPIQRTRSLETINKWGLEDDDAMRLLDDLSTGFYNTEGNVRVGFRPRLEAFNFAVSLGVNFARFAETHEIPTPPSAKIGSLAARNLIVIRYDQSAPTMPQVFAHELVHDLERTNNPLKVLSSQRAVDMRMLREELKAFNKGAEVSMHLIDKQAPSFEARKTLIGSDAQLYVDHVRQTVNNGDSDQFRATPEMFDQLAAAGWDIDDILHGRINFDRMAALLGSN